MKQLLLIAAFCASAASPLHAQSTLQRIQSTHQFHCGVIRQDPEYSSNDDHSSRGAFDDELCRAFAVAVLGPQAKLGHEVILTPFLDDRSAMDSLRAGAIDVIPTISADFTHQNARSLTLSPPDFIDTLGLIVPRASHVTHAAQLAGRQICVLAETEADEALQEWFAAHHHDLLQFPFQEEGEMEAAYASHNCAAMASDRTRLALLQASLGSESSHHTVLPEILALDPMAAATRADDPTWSHLITAVIEVLLNAEALRIGQHTSRTHLRPAQQRLLGLTRELSAQFNLRASWPADVIQSVGNYAELYDRTLGRPGTHTIPRGPNRLVTQGGMLIPLPLK